MSRLVIFILFYDFQKSFWRKFSFTTFLLISSLCLFKTNLWVFFLSASQSEKFMNQFS